MGMVKGLFQSNKTVTVEFRNKITTNTSGVIASTYPTVNLTATGIMWTGTTADAVVSERLRADLAGVIVIDPDDYTTTITDTAKATVDGTEYSVIYVDNVANQDQVIQIPVKRFS